MPVSCFQSTVMFVVAPNAKLHGLDHSCKCPCTQVTLLTQHLVRVLRVASSLQVLDAGSFAIQVPSEIWL